MKEGKKKNIYIYAKKNAGEEEGKTVEQKIKRPKPGTSNKKKRNKKEKHTTPYNPKKEEEADRKDRGGGGKLEKMEAKQRNCDFEVREAKNVVEGGFSCQKGGPRSTRRRKRRRVGRRGRAERKQGDEEEKKTAKQQQRNINVSNANAKANKYMPQKETHTLQHSHFLHIVVSLARHNSNGDNLKRRRRRCRRFAFRPLCRKEMALPWQKERALAWMWGLWILITDSVDTIPANTVGTVYVVGRVCG